MTQESAQEQEADLYAKAVELHEQHPDWDNATIARDMTDTWGMPAIVDHVDEALHQVQYQALCPLDTV